MKQKVMDAMQSFSRALMGPVLFLPIAGMLQAISSVMSNTALVTEGGVVWTLGKFINGGVGAVIGNLGILFCVGIAMSLAKKRKQMRHFWHWSAIWSGWQPIPAGWMWQD